MSGELLFLWWQEVLKLQACGESLHACPDQPWGPPSTLGTGFLLAVKWPWRVADYSSLLVPRLRMRLSYTSASLLCFHRHVMGDLYLLQHVRLIAKIRADFIFLETWPVDHISDPSLLYNKQQHCTAFKGHVP